MDLHLVNNLTAPTIELSILARRIQYNILARDRMFELDLVAEVQGFSFLLVGAFYFPVYCRIRTVIGHTMDHRQELRGEPEAGLVYS